MRGIIFHHSIRKSNVIKKSIIYLYIYFATMLVHAYCIYNEHFLCMAIWFTIKDRSLYLCWGVAQKRNVFRGKYFADPTIKKSKIS
jgi:hypothetical protein